MLVGTEDFTKRARKMRTILGGQMRQAGIIAAAGIVALETMIDSLKEDHDKSRVLAQGITGIEGVNIKLDRVQSNMVFFDVERLGITAKTFASHLEDYNVKINVRGKSLVRAIVYKDISYNDIDYVFEAIKEVAANLARDHGNRQKRKMGG